MLINHLKSNYVYQILHHLIYFLIYYKKFQDFHIKFLLNLHKISILSNYYHLLIIQNY